jgi:hypothetical protein
MPFWKGETASSPVAAFLGHPHSPTEAAQAKSVAAAEGVDIVPELDPRLPGCGHPLRVSRFFQLRPFLECRHPQQPFPSTLGTWIPPLDSSAGSAGGERFGWSIDQQGSFLGPAFCGMHAALGSEAPCGGGAGWDDAASGCWSDQVGGRMKNDYKLVGEWDLGGKGTVGTRYTATLWQNCELLSLLHECTGRPAVRAMLFEPSIHGCDRCRSARVIRGCRSCADSVRRWRRA